MSNTETPNSNSGIDESKIKGLPTEFTMEEFEHTRKEAKITITLDEYLRGINKGRHYLNVKVDKETLPEVLKAFDDLTVGIVSNALSLKLQEVTEDAIDKDGILDLEKFKRGLDNINVSGESIPKLEARQIELANLMANLHTDPSKLLNADGTPNMEAIMAVNAKAQAYSKEITENRLAIADKRRKSSDTETVDA